MENVEINAEDLINQLKANFANKLADYESQIAILQVQNKKLRDELSHLKPTDKGAK